VKTIVLDLESIPADTPTLERIMPEEIARPVMPEEIANPIPPDFAAKCPKYGGDEKKRADWMWAAKKKWETTAEEAKAKWQQGALDARARYVENAALHAETGHAKMIGLCVGDETLIYLWEPDRAKVDLVEAEAKRQKVTLFPFMLEQQMFRAFSVMLLEAMGGDGGATRLFTFYGNTFDLPFLARRSTIVGDPGLLRFLRKHKHGRYLDGARFVDLHEDWTLGDRETRTGGLDGLCKILGVECKARADGATFYRWYQEDPTEGLVYLLQDLRCVAACAGCMGFEMS
jgi:hypothetical protein